MFARILILVLGVGLTSAVSAESIPAEKRAQIDKFLALTEVGKLTNLMASSLTQQIIQPLKEKHGSVDPAVVQVIFREAKELMYEEFTLNNRLNDIFYELYDEYFTTEQMKVLVEFYSSSTGKIVQKAMQEIAQRSMAETKKHATTLGPKIQQRLLDKFDEIGLAMDQAEAKAP